jgi:Spy/CpxP family protein refolding chaperone
MKHAVWALAALLILPAYTGAAELCERNQPQNRGGQGDPQRGGGKDGKPDQGHQPPPKWWIDPQLRQQLTITDSQSKAIDEIWQKSAPPLFEGWHRLDSLESTLSQMIQDGAEEAAVVAQIQKVETTRAELNKGRTLMLYRMNKLLSPDQRAKVKALREHRDGGRRESSR